MKYANGFTLIELLVTLVVAGILLVVATPGFRSFIEDNRVSASSNDFVNAVAIARSEAIRRREPVTLCSSNDQQSCSGNLNWGNGWIVFNDRNNNGRFDGLVTDPPEVVLRAWEALPGGLTLIATTGVADIQFDRLGAASTNETFRLSNPYCQSGQANRERSILLVGSGVVGVTRTDCP